MMPGNNASPAMQKIAAANTTAAVKATLTAIPECTVPCHNRSLGSAPLDKA